MAFYPVTSKPSVIAVATGGAVFWLLSIFSIPIFIQTQNASLLYAAFIASGITTGFLARRSPLMHGFLLALLIAVLVSGFPYLFEDRSYLQYLSPLKTLANHLAAAAMPGLLLSPLGALVGDMLGNSSRGL